MENTHNKFDAALSQLHALLFPPQKSWMVIGTASLYLSAFEVSPNDIDILSTIEDAHFIEQQLYAYKIESDVEPNQKFRSRFTKYRIAGVLVELMGGLKVNTAEGWLPVSELISQPQKVIHQGNDFLVPGKADQLNIYTTFNREKDGKILSILRS